MDCLLKKLYWLDSQMEIIEEFMNGTSTQDLEVLQMKTYAYNKYWEAYDEIQEKIEELKNNPNKTLEKEYLESENYDALVEAMRDLELRDKKKKLPKFSGNLEDWPLFRKKFEKNVHSAEELSPAQKLGYLRTSLNEEASAELLKGSSDTYTETWDEIKKHYDTMLEDKLREEVD